MIKKNLLKDIAQQLTDVLPADISALKKDFEKNCQHILTTAFARLDLVTREEFDVQTKVLARTRQKMEALQQQIEALEKALHDQPR